MSITTYDPKCGALAREWLTEYPQAPPDAHDSLALAIQQAIEDWCEAHVDAQPAEDEA